MPPDASLPPFRLAGGALDGGSPLILSSPHSGALLPPAFLKTLRASEHQAHRIADNFVDALLAGVGGVPLVSAIVARAVIDLNRAPNELDPQMFDGPVAERPRQSERVRRGHGLFPRVGADGRALHRGRLAAATARQWIDTVHRPWHQALAGGLAHSRQRHGYAVLLDMHSMPSLEGPQPARIVLGDRFGHSAAPQLVDWLEARFQAAGFHVARNRPYAGGFTTEHHGRPGHGVHAVQIEMDRGLYMNQVSLEPHAGFAPLATLLAAVIGDLMAALPALALWPATATTQAAE